MHGLKPAKKLALVLSSDTSECAFVELVFAHLPPPQLIAADFWPFVKTFLSDQELFRITGTEVLTSDIGRGKARLHCTHISSLHSLKLPSCFTNICP